MKTLRRYLWVEISTATGFVLFALLSLFTFFDLVAQLDEIGQRGFKLRHALSYVAFTLPSRMYELMPIAALIGTIYALSKLAANSEFTIMRVSGMSTRRLMLSLGGIGLIIVAITYLLGEFLSPPAEKLAQQIRLKARGSQISVRDFRSGVWVRDVVKAADGRRRRLSLHQRASGVARRRHARLADTRIRRRLPAAVGADSRCRKVRSRSRVGAQRRGRNPRTGDRRRGRATDRSPHRSGQNCRTCCGTRI